MHGYLMGAGIMAPLLDDGGEDSRFRRGIAGVCYRASKEKVKGFLYISHGLTALGRKLTHCILFFFYWCERVVDGLSDEMTLLR